MMDLLDLPPLERQLLTWMLRSGEVSVAQVCERLQVSLPEAEALLLSLEQRGYVRQIPGADPPRFGHSPMPKTGRRLSSGLWRALDGDADA